MPFELTIAAFPHGGDIPELYTCDGANLSPALEWKGAPAGALSFALIVDDPDAPGGTWNHWLLCDIPKATTAIPQGVRLGSIGVSGSNDFGKLGYGGPCPPKGHGPHHYNFRLMALNVTSLGLRDGEKRDSLDIALRGHVLSEVTYTGLYKRR
jgi:Raf kinase inhibitor-like YbhB/YbcL family protein